MLAACLDYNIFLNNFFVLELLQEHNVNYKKMGEIKIKKKWEKWEKLKFKMGEKLVKWEKLKFRTEYNSLKFKKILLSLKFKKLLTLF